MKIQIYRKSVFQTVQVSIYKRDFQQYMNLKIHIMYN